MNETTIGYEAHHADNQRRFMVIEAKLDAITAGAEKQSIETAKMQSDTADLLDMWRDAGVFFKWMRKAGELIVGIRNVALAAVAVYVLWRYGTDGKP